MAHISDMLAHSPSTWGLNNYIARELSPSLGAYASLPAPTNVAPTPDSEEALGKISHVTEPRNHLTFLSAKEMHPSTAVPKSIDEPFPSSMAPGGINETEIPPPASGLRLVSKDKLSHRRRKPSLPELGPMTTVQENPMDSPTIPGRPPLHERSSSVPSESWRQHVFGDATLSRRDGPKSNEKDKIVISDEHRVFRRLNGNASCNNLSFYLNNTPLPLSTPGSPSSVSTYRSTTAKHQCPPRSLAPIVIPSPLSAKVQHAQGSSSTSRDSSDSPPEVPPKSARKKADSLHSRASPYNPMSSMSSLLSHFNPQSSTLNTPDSALSHPRSSSSDGFASPRPPHYPSAAEGRSSPRPSIGASSCSNTYSSAKSKANSTGKERGAEPNRFRNEISISIRDRRRPQKVATNEEVSPMKCPESKYSVSNAICTTPDTTPSPSPEPKSSRSRAEARRAFEKMPTGYSASSAAAHLPAAEIQELCRQAQGQTARFQVLRAKDVEALTRELRALDERCEYLRKTHRSLRAGRRNLHERICAYLRSPRTARFSNESMLKQEEVLSELDTSIDDWVYKLEQADNRRTRVRQKLLEHIATAATLLPPDSAISMALASEHVGLSKQEKRHVTAHTVRGREPDTPPRSPTKVASLPRTDRVVEEVRVASPEQMRRLRNRSNTQYSIQVYADGDLSSLGDDDESETLLMNSPTLPESPGPFRFELREKKHDPVVQAVEAAPLLLNAVAFEGMALHTQHTRRRNFTT